MEKQCFFHRLLSLDISFHLQGVYRDWDDKPECVVWTGTGEAGGEGYLVGVQSGALVLRNTANLSYNITSFQALNRPLYRLAANPER